MKMMDQILVIDNCTYPINHIKIYPILRLINSILIRIIKMVINNPIRNLREVNSRFLRLLSGRFIKWSFEAISFEQNDDFYIFLINFLIKDSI